MQNAPAIQHELVSLLNQSGKLRMLSHRAIMMLLLEQFDPKRAKIHRDELKKTISTFREFSDLFIEPEAVKGELQACAIFLAKKHCFEKSAIESVIFFRKAIFQKIAAGQKIDIDEITPFSQFVASDLLAAVNHILEGITNQIAKIAQSEEDEANRKHAVISRSVEELEKSARMVYMISLNASIEASRLGNDGAGFKQIVREVRELSDQMGNSASKLKVEIFENAAQ
jgi:hypothetical protein